MAKKSVLIILAVLILVSTHALAVDIEVKHTGPAYVQAGAEAEYDITVKNTDYRQQILDLSPDPLSMLPSSWFEYVILEETRIILDAQEERTFTVTIKLKNTVPTDENYGTFIRLKSPFDATEVTHNFILRVVPPEEILTMSVETTDKATPGTSYTVNVELINNLNVQLQDLKLVVSSPLFTEEKILKFFALQDRTETFSFPIQPLAKPEGYTLQVRVIYNDEIIERTTVLFQVLENADVKEKRHVVTGFLTKTFTISKTNYGNTRVIETYDIPLSRFQRLFVSYSEQPSLINSEKVHWEFTIDPDTSYTISATVNYRPLGIAGILLVIFTFFVYFWLTKTVQIKKQILKVRETKEGISELKILLHIKNKTPRTLRHLAVVEILPKIIEPTKDFGTLKPEKIQKGERGTRLMWIIPELVKGEERIISYKVRSKINIVGTFILPLAQIKYKNNSRKIVVVESNSTRFTVGVEKDQ